jgi:integrase/recombinase XerD
MTEISPLRRRMVEDMTVRNLSPARSYLYAVAKFSRFFGKSPERLDLEDVRTYQVHLASQGIAWATLNQTVAALRFFYGVTLGRPEIPERIAYAREPRRLPVVLSADEVVRFLEAVPSLKSRTALTTAYAAGLRVSEVVALKVADIDSGRMLIRVEQGKGGKDRYVMLSAQLLAILRTYWRLAKPRHWLFPGRDEDRPDGPPCRLPLGLRGGRADQARHHPAPQLRHPPAGERRRHPHHPGSARAHQHLDDRALRPGCDQHDPGHRQPARQAPPGGRAARLSAGRWPLRWRWRTSSGATAPTGAPPTPGT